MRSDWTLTSREREVVRLIAQGLSNAAIARGLRISVGTVKQHVHHAFVKTNTTSRLELALWARKKLK